MYTLPPPTADPGTLVKMYGPSLSDPSKMVNRDVPLRDVPAFSRAGYKPGRIAEPIEEVVAKAVEAELRPKGKKKNAVG